MKELLVNVLTNAYLQRTKLEPQASEIDNIAISMAAENVQNRRQMFARIRMAKQRSKEQVLNSKHFVAVPAKNEVAEPATDVVAEAAKDVVALTAKDVFALPAKDVVIAGPSAIEVFQDAAKHKITTIPKRVHELADWDFENQHATLRCEGMEYHSKQVFPMNPKHGDRSKVGIKFVTKNGTEITTSISSIWWAIVAPHAASESSTSSMFRPIQVSP